MNEEIVYKYLDDSIRTRREQVLKETFNSKQINNDELNFLDLSMYKNSNNLRNSISRIIYNSKIDNNVVLTKYQIEILNILDNHNIFLSAPTSFGKTFILLEYIKRNSDKLNNIVFIIPTIALMNELLKKFMIILKMYIIYV